MTNEELILTIKQHIKRGMDWIDSIEYIESKGKKINDMQFKIIVDEFINKNVEHSSGVCDAKR